MEAERHVIIVGTLKNFYPEYTVDPNGRSDDFAIQMMDAVARHAGLSVSYRPFETLAEVFAALDHGDIDVIPLVTITRERERRMLFTRALLTLPTALFVRLDTENIRSWADLADRSIGVISSGISEELLKQRGLESRLVSYPRLQDALFGLMAGDIDALVSFENSVLKLAQRARIDDRIKVIDEPLTEARRAIAVRKDLPDLQHRLDLAVDDFMNTTEYRESLTRWYADLPPFWTPARATWIAGASLALLLLAMLIWQTLSVAARDRRLDEDVLGTVPLGPPSDEDIGARVARGCGLTALALGVVVLLGWAFDAAMLKNVLPGLVAMQPWTATAIALGGAALLAATAPGKLAATLFLTFSGGVLIIGLHALIEYTTGINFGADIWLFSESLRSQPAPYPYPGRPSQATSVAFILLGAALLLAHRLSSRRGAPMRAAFLTLGTLGLMWTGTPLLGYAIDIAALLNVPFFRELALNTALGLTVLFAGVLALRPGVGWISTLLRDRPGAASARMLLPVVVFGPVLLAMLVDAGRRAELYGTQFCLALFTLSTITLLATSVLWSAVRVDRLHRARLAAAGALRESEGRLAAIVESSDDAIISKTLESIITSWNPAAERLFGYSAAEAIGQPIFLILPELQVSEEAELLARIRRAEHVAHYETKRRRRDGSEVDVSISLSPLHAAGGEIVGAAAIMRDISEQKRRDEDLHRSNAELEQFAYVASHDLQEPLRAVANFTELLAQRYQGKLDERADKYIHYACEGARQMQRLIADLLAYSRVGSEAKPLEPVSSGFVLNRVLRSLRRVISETGAQIDHGPLPVVLADEIQLAQLFQNVIGNAIKFRSKAPPKVNVSAEPNGGHWHFIIADNGIGMDMRYAERIFQMFQRLNERGKFEGSGIGLAIAKRIVERHGGRVWVESELDVGTTFHFTLQAARDDHAETD
ncbi:MAG: transporter substrate-binding domain-containing protein [Rhodospirillales bacterium]|nr:transporter substrate-binding domain-containing protein [Rhodospirillales bacterium]